MDKQYVNQSNGLNNNLIKKLQQSQNTYINKSKYCTKCLRELDMNDRDIVKDAEGNLFCDFECKQSYWREVNKELDCCLSEWRRSGR